MLADPDEDGLLDFAAGDEGNTFLVGSGKTVRVRALAAWAPAAFSDFDLYLTSAATGGVVAIVRGRPAGVRPDRGGLLYQRRPDPTALGRVVHHSGNPCR